MRSLVKNLRVECFEAAINVTLVNVDIPETDFERVARSFWITWWDYGKAFGSRGRSGVHLAGLEKGYSFRGQGSPSPCSIKVCL